MDFHGYGPNWECAEQHCVLRNSISFLYQYFPSNIAYSVHVVNSNTYTCVSPLKPAKAHSTTSFNRTVNSLSQLYKEWSLVNSIIFHNKHCGICQVWFKCWLEVELFWVMFFIGFLRFSREMLIPSENRFSVLMFHHA